MSVARRVYLYGVSAISLLVLVVGMFLLVAVALGELVDAFGAGIIGGGGGIGREQVSLAIALVVVGLPIFGIHWSLVGRAWRGTDDAALEDRRSTIRAFHLGFVATVALAIATFAALQVLDEILRTVLGADRAGDEGGFSDDLAWMIVALPVWWYHARRRNADLRHDRLTGAPAWLTRLHRYGWAFVGLLVLLIGASQVIETVASVLIGRNEFGTDARWWLGPLAWSISAIVVGLGVFLLHADDARRAIRDAAIIGEDDRASAMRATYFGAVILVALTDVGLTAASSLAELGRWMIGVGGGSGIASFLELVIGPWLVAVPFAVAGWLHWGVQRREAAQRSPLALATAERLALHLTAGLGLAFLAVGTSQLLGRLLEVTLGRVGGDDLFRSELAWLLAQIVVGAALWIPAWAVVLRRRAEDATTERVATAGRAYLFLVVGASLIAAVPSAVFSLYRLIDTLLGGRGVALGSDVAIPIAVVIVASVVAAYHGRMIASDLRFAAGAEPPAGAVAAATTSVLAAEPSPGASLTLTLRGPAGTDLESVAAILREHLPAGVVIESA